MSSVRTKTSDLLFPLLAVMLALCVSGVLVYRSYQAEDDLRAQTVLSTEVLERLRHVEAGILDAETGQRGYILTGNPAYLAPYRTGPQLYADNFARLSEILAEVASDTQRAALADLASLAEQKFDELAETIRLTDTGRRPDALALINSDLGKTLMQDIRARVETLVAQEQAILAAALRGARTERTRTALVLGATALSIVLLLGLVWFLFERSVRLDRTEELLREVAEHRDRNALLVGELSHRVKNLFGIVTSIVRMTGRGETDAKTAVAKISDRIAALSRAHALTTLGTPERTILLSDLVETVLDPYASDARRYRMEGPPVTIPDAYLTPLGLILHELATNAVKYGAWRAAGAGDLAITWDQEEDATDQNAGEVRLLWTETLEEAGAPAQSGDAGAPAQSGDAGTPAQSGDPDPDASASSGFGSKMMTMSAAQLGGTLERDWRGGLTVRLRFRPEAVPTE